jgi:hypothetical protein
MLALRLTFLAMLDAQRLAEQHHPTDAVLRMCDVLGLSRHMSQTSSAPGLRTALVVEQTGIQFIADYLLDMPKQDLHSIHERLERLPPASNYAEVARRASEENNDEDSPATRPATRSTQPATAQALTPEEAKLEKAAEDAARRIERAAMLPVDQLAEELAPILSNESEEFGIIRFLAGTLINTRVAEVKVQAKREMLRAGVLVAMHGPAGADPIRDPFGKGPFQYHELDHGFELLSRLSLERQSVSLQFVRE